MLTLDDPKWSELRHGYGSGSEVPEWIREIQMRVEGGLDTDNMTDPPIWQLCHDWSTYDATYAAIPHLIQICGKAQPDSHSRILLLIFIGWCVACLRLNETEVSADLKRWFEASVPVARDLIGESLPFVKDEQDSQDHLRNLLGAFATCHGNPDLGFVLFELDAGGFRCDNCREFIQPMVSSLNPFWVERKRR